MHITYNAAYNSLINDSKQFGARSPITPIRYQAVPPPRPNPLIQNPPECYRHGKVSGIILEEDNKIAQPLI